MKQRKTTSREYAAGVAHTYQGLTILFPFGVAPKLLFLGIPTKIDDPERFGSWDSTKARRDFTLSFYDNKVIHGVTE